MHIKVRTDKIPPGAVITSVAEYLEYIHDACSNFSDPLFRGHSQESWSLVPKIARIELRDDTDLPDAEQAMLDDFRRRAVPLVDFQPQTDWEWLAIAQHFGLATRLLDWTTNPLAALWFAVDKPAEKGSRAAVWIFHAFPADYVADPEGESPFSTVVTRVFRPKHMTRRVVAQDGWFTVHKYMNKTRGFVPLEKNSRYARRLSYVAVPPDAFVRLRAELDRCGVNPAALFADLPGLSRHVQWKVSPLEDEE